MYSLRRRLVLVLAIGFTILIVGTGVYLAGVLRDQVTEQFDAALLAKANALAALTEDEGGQIELDYTPRHMPEYERKDKPEYFQFWLDDGRPLYPARKQDDAKLPLIEPAPTTPHIQDVTLHDGRPGRMVEFRYHPRYSNADDPVDSKDPEVMGTAKGRPALILAVGREREPLDALIGRIHVAIFGVGGIAALLAILLVWMALASGLRPVDEIAMQVELMDADSLDARVELEQTPKELSAIVQQLNALLDRLDESFERERRFAGNVAHELRTPIAELRSLAAVGAAWPDDKDSVVHFFEDVGGIAGRMERVITDLLLLARCEAGVERAVSTRTDLRDVIETTWSAFEPRATLKGVTFELELPDAFEARSDPGKLAIVFANLLGNAVSYARSGTAIRCVGSRTERAFQIEVTNVTEPMSTQDLARLAEPFWRKDEARSSEEHAGLGLALVTALTELLGLDLAFDVVGENTFRVRLAGALLETTERTRVAT